MKVYLIIDKAVYQNSIDNLLQQNPFIQENNRIKVTHEKNANDIIPNISFPYEVNEPPQYFGKEVYFIELAQPSEIFSYVSLNINHLVCFVFQDNKIFDYDIANDLVLLESETVKNYYL